MKTLEKNIPPKSNSGNKSVFFQPKLTINQPNDIYEQEADEMANRVMRMTIPAYQGSDNGTFFPARNPSDKLANISTVQRRCAHCEEEEREHRLHRKENSSSETQSNSSIENYVGSLNGRGNYLSPQTRSFFEPRFGYDLSNVRVHNDSVAAKSADSINAIAYTSGNNIVFNQKSIFA